MIEFEHKKYGKMIIIDREDNPNHFDMYSDNFHNNNSRYPTNFTLLTGLPISKLLNVNVVLLRDKKNKHLEAVKNRYGFLNFTESSSNYDYFLNYGVEVVEVLDPIESRFEILDIR